MDGLKHRFYLGDSLSESCPVSKRGQVKEYDFVAEEYVEMARRRVEEVE